MSHHKISHHIHILMSGHNPEHHHKKDSHRETGNVHHKKPCDILMREHHYSGGISGVPPHFSKGGKASRGRKFAEGGHVDHESKGGRTHRRRQHADGGHAFENMSKMNLLGGVPISMQPHFMQSLSNTRGYSEGGKIDHESKGGRLHHHRRKHHADGGDANEVKSQYYGKLYKKGGHCYAEGGETEKDYGEKPLTGQLRKGGRAHHYDGEPVADNSVREERHKGGRAKRQHHYWGQNVIGRLPLVGGLANTIANTAGTLDPHKYGGSEYVAKKKGQKAADILSTIGNLGATVALLKKGGGVHHKYRKHHAAGGAGKVRKGMMTESGRMIHYD